MNRFVFYAYVGGKGHSSGKFECPDIVAVRAFALQTAHRLFDVRTNETVNVYCTEEDSDATIASCTIMGT